MGETIYNWKRYWHPSHKSAPLLDSGFLYAPDEFSYFHSQNDWELATFEGLSNIRCLILLGEPGMGKSQALNDAYDSLSSPTQPDYETLLFKLANYSDENRLVQKLFQSDKFRQWLAGSHTLHLFLDDLDEARLKIDTITYCLIEELSDIKNHLSRLTLRIACRTSDWPQEFERQLRELYGEQQVKIYRLAPLQIKDAQEAAEMHHIDWNAFWSEIREKDIGPLAANPITLRLLFAQYNRTQQLPSKRYEIYEKGCQELCIEEKERHKQRDDLKAEQRFEIAARVAACMVFANYQSIVTHEKANLSDGIDDFLVLSDVTDSPDTLFVETLPVYRDAVIETLETALFNGSTSKTWAHKTFAEFLAAWYATHRLDERQIKELLFLNGKIVPQLRVVGAWMACVNDEIWSAIMEHDPELLLRSDIVKDDINLKAKWVELMLKKHAVGAVLDYGTQRQYAKLKYRGLATQLRSVLEDRSQSIFARIEAVTIAAACQEQELQNILAAIALDDNESMQLREEAAGSLAIVGDSPTKAQLRALALLPILDSTTRRLKEYALKCVWPDQITTTEFLDSVDLHYAQDHEYSPPNSRERDVYDIGDYLPGLLEQNYEKLDLIACLHWIQQQPKSHVLPFAYQDMIDVIMVIAWEQIEQEQVADAFADAVLSRIYLYDSILPGRRVLEDDFYAKISSNVYHRQRILRRIILRISALDHDADRLIYANTPFITSQDADFYVQEFNASNSPVVRANWAQILQILLIRGLNIKQVASLYDTCQACPELNQALGSPFDAMSVDSDVAKRHRQLQAEHKRHRTERATQPLERLPIEPIPLARVLQYLAECEEGKHESWWQLSYWMMFLPDGTRNQRHDEHARIEDLPVWQELTNEPQARIVQTAKVYILNFVPNDTEWLIEGKYAENSFYYAIVAGYRALYLLLAKERPFISSLSTIIWQRWAATLLYYSWSAYRRSTKDSSDMKIHYELLCCAYQHAPDRVVVSLSQIIELDNEYGVKSLVEWIKPLWDDHLSQALVDKLTDKSLNPLIMYELLLPTLKHGNVPAKQYAEFLVKSLFKTADDPFSERSILAARALLTAAEDAGWDVVWPSFQTYPKFGEQVLGWIINDHEYRRFHRSYIQEKLTERQLVDFYVWLCVQFPPNEDWRWAGQITQRDEFARFRDATLYVLQQRDPKLAIEALEELAGKLPHNESVRWRLAQTQDRLQRETWQPPLPRQIIEYAREHKLHQMTSQQINTGGGPYIAGDVNIAGGDFISRDKIETVD